MRIVCWFWVVSLHSLFFFFNDTATTEIYTLSLHDALPICAAGGQPDKRQGRSARPPARAPSRGRLGKRGRGDRKSTRLNSSHTVISYAVFCLKKKNKKERSNSKTEPTALNNKKGTARN